MESQYDGTVDCERCGRMYYPGDAEDRRQDARRHSRLDQLDAEGRPVRYGWGRRFARARDAGMSMVYHGKTMDRRLNGMVLAARAWFDRAVSGMLLDKGPIPTFETWVASFDIEGEFKSPQVADVVAEFRKLYPRRCPAA